MQGKAGNARKRTRVTRSDDAAGAGAHSPPKRRCMGDDASAAHAGEVCDVGASLARARPGIMESLPAEMLAAIKAWLDPASSLLFRSTCTAARALTTPADRRWDTETGPVWHCIRRALPLVGLTLERLVDVGRPVSSKRRWPQIYTTGRQTPIDEPTLKRYALNATLLAYLAHTGFVGATDDFGQAWDDSMRSEVDDKKRWNFLRLPAPGGTGPDAKALCTLTYVFDCTQGDYKCALFRQSKGANAAGVDLCFEQAAAVYDQALSAAFGARGIPFRLDLHRYGGPAPRIREAQNAPPVRPHVFGGAPG